MKIELPLCLEPNLIKFKNLSFCNYIQKEPQIKNEVYIKNNIMIFVIKGTKLLHFENSSIQVNKDSILFLRSGNYIMSEILDEYYESLLFLYEDSLLLDFIKKYNISFKNESLKEINILKIDSSFEFKNLIDTTKNYFLKDIKNKEELIKLKLEEAFLNILNSSSKEQFINLLASIYKSNYFKIEVEKNFTYEDNILDLAYKFNMPEVSFRKKFKEVFKMTPKKWQVIKRLEKAKVLLESTNMNVSEVCIQTGFDNLSWFIQTFKKYYNQTPTQLKNNKK